MDRGKQSVALDKFLIFSDSEASAAEGSATSAGRELLRAQG